ncbi:acyltransferase [Sphingomonas panacisoli]|uniref:Acyltransferase n=1 Tax=Sphingomonas panacisoli TaxID=1813879 RepID=A0A5B8LHY4_9SPHN|nr:acyltransferase [Sphingomonas panacisoli]QDZ07445.1 acyltransferase [Sphingomonas panacisoli]
MHNPFLPGFYCSEELREFGFAHVGDGVQVSKDCVIVSPENVTIGDHSRIDAGCHIIATGPVEIGRHVHIGGGCHLSGRGGITMADFSGLSQGVRIYSASDDYSGRHMTNPTVPEEFTNVRVAPCRLGRHVIVGSGSVILPGVVIGDGAAVGALSLVSHRVPEWTIYAGSPARRVAERSRGLLVLEAAMEGTALAEVAG